MTATGDSIATSFFESCLLPAILTIDLGCGEGRLTRHLKSSGHQVIGIDASPSLVAAARASDPSMSILRADAARFRWPDKCADLVDRLHVASRYRTDA